MIPAQCDIPYLEKHYALKVEYLGKTLRIVDGKSQWCNVKRITAHCEGKQLTGYAEVLSDKYSAELMDTQTSRMIDSLKLEILKREEAKANG